MIGNSDKCKFCRELNKILDRKEQEIESIKCEIKQLNEQLLFYRTSFIDTTQPELDSNVQAKSSIKCETKDVDTQTTESCFKHSSFSENPEDLSGNEQAKELDDSSKKEPGQMGDYIYDEAVKMYYSPSTGYYYDEVKGLLYEPNSETYYKYNYDDKTYESVPNENLKSSCETVLDQVNKLNLNDSEDNKDNQNSCSKITIKEEGMPKDSVIIETEKCEVDGNSDATKDWHLPEGTNLTVTDLVKEVVNEHYGMSDYVYDENCKMYYSQSTGYYYDIDKNLLYEPSSQTYYTYESSTQSYQFYYQVGQEEKKKSKSRNRKHRNRKKEKTSANEHPASKSKIKKVKKERGGKAYSSPEEGEIISDSDSPPSSPEIVISPTISFNENSADLLPPCIRAIVEDSENLQIGSLLMITFTGATIGREKSNSICIPDITVSKFHAHVLYDEESRQYIIEDLGSQRGTFINETRLSQPRIQSEAHMLNHCDILLLGSCKLRIHIHEKLETCDKCEPGHTIAELAPQEKIIPVFKSKEEREKERRAEVKKMKMKYGIQPMSEGKRTVGSGYEDKSEIRRKTVGSQNPYEKDEVGTSLDEALGASNRGYQLLQKMGWKEGQCLGTTEAGRTSPIPFKTWATKAGLGSTEVAAQASPPRQDKRTQRWIKAQERYFQLK